MYTYKYIGSGKRKEVEKEVFISHEGEKGQKVLYLHFCLKF